MRLSSSKEFAGQTDPLPIGPFSPASSVAKWGEGKGGGCLHVNSDYKLRQTSQWTPLGLDHPFKFTVTLFASTARTRMA